MTREQKRHWERGILVVSVLITRERRGTGREEFWYGTPPCCCMTLRRSLHYMQVLVYDIDFIDSSIIESMIDDL
jgi:hypothetical protein